MSSHTTSFGIECGIVERLLMHHSAYAAIAVIASPGVLGPSGELRARAWQYESLLPMALSDGEKLTSHASSSSILLHWTAQLLAVPTLTSFTDHRLALRVCSFTWAHT